MKNPIGIPLKIMFPGNLNNKNTMKKIFYFAVAIVAMSCCSSHSDKQETVNPSYQHCGCLLCEASDSLNYYATLDAEAWDSTWWYPHSENFNQWYDSLTTILVGMIDEYPDDSIQTYAIDMADDLKDCPSFMQVIDNGFDGLCDFYAYPKRFGSDAVKVLGIDTAHPSYMVRNDVKGDWDIYQNKVDSFIKYFYE